MNFKQFLIETSEFSPEFLTWFQGSKVVDANGKPLIVYHGTKTGFKNFKVPKDHGRLYFTTNKEYATQYTTDAFHPSRKTTSPKVHAVYLKIVNPIDLDAFGRADPKYDDIGFGAKSWKTHGYDGAYSTEGGGTWQVFDSSQIRYAEE